MTEPATDQEIEQYRMGAFNSPLPNDVSTAIRKLLARLAIAESREGWRPIETAPRDGTVIWLANEHSLRVGAWISGRWADWVRAELGGTCDLHFTPTHWAPVPTPPSPSGE